MTSCWKASNLAGIQVRDTLKLLFVRLFEYFKDDQVYLCPVFNIFLTAPSWPTILNLLQNEYVQNEFAVNLAGREAHFSYARLHDQLNDDMIFNT